MLKEPPQAYGRIPVPGGWLSTDTVLATQLAQIGCTSKSDLYGTLKANEKKMMTYRSPNDSLLIVFDYLTIQIEDKGNSIVEGRVRYALKK